MAPFSCVRATKVAVFVIFLENGRKMRRLVKNNLYRTGSRKGDLDDKNIFSPTFANFTFVKTFKFIVLAKFSKNGEIITEL